MARGSWLLAGAVVGVAAARPAAALQLRYHFRPGATTRYRVMVAAGALTQSPAAAQPMKVQFSLDTHAIQKVLSVSPSGVAEMEYVNTAGTLKTTTGGKTSATPAAREVARMRLTDRGKLLSYHTQDTGRPPAAAAADSAAGLDQSDPLRALTGLNFPDRDLKPGDHWSSESTVDLGNGRSVKMKIASKFLSLTNYKGRKCARIRTSFEMPMDTGGLDGESRGLSVNGRGKVAGQLTTLFDYVAGQEIYTDGSVLMLVKLQMSAAADPSGAGQAIDMTSAMKLNVRQVLVD